MSAFNKYSFRENVIFYTAPKAIKRMVLFENTFVYLVYLRPSLKTIMSHI